jgi:hypothetical protein
VSRSAGYASLVVLVLVLALALTACGDDSPSSARSAAVVAPPAAAPLALTESPLPRLRMPDIRTGGTYPQVTGRGLDLHAVNAALRRMVLAGEAQYARPGVASAADSAGIYATTFDRKLVSASSRVVSVLVPTVAHFPGANDVNFGWLSATLEVPSGRRVRLGQLFADPAQGLNAVAVAFETLALASVHLPDLCFAGTQGFAPTESTYRSFALTPSGLAIGLAKGEWGAEACGSLQETVPYTVLGRYWSRLGRRLVAGVRRPRR